MQTNTSPYLLAALAVAVFPAGASADSPPGPSPLDRSPQSAQPARKACGQPDVSARLAIAAPIEVPALEASRGGPYGSVALAVTLAPDGTLLRAAVLHSSGNRRVDDTALAAIRSSKYEPERRSCGDVGGTYEVDADFDG